MNVTIVVPKVLPKQTHSWIVWRLAKHLMKRNGWEMSNEPNKKADANLFFPYLEWRFHNWHKTPCAAFMTHYVKTDRMRRECWERVADHVDMRVTMCEQYVEGLSEYGLTVNITPPVELDKFVIADSPNNGQPIIGVAGEVYRGGRKGEGLIKKLAQYNRHRWAFRAAGVGWPVQTRFYEWKHMQRFYQGLDVFLCTSTIEGGPVTVLEALACGKPVVVPKDVGLIDELPKEKGIWRYKKGDYQSMIRAIEKAVAHSPVPKVLRSYVEDRTIERYCQEWREAVEKMLEPTPVEIEEPEGDLPAWRGSSGVYIVAYGKRAHDCAYHLIKSLHKRNPHLRVCLACEGYADNFQKPVNISDKGYSHPLSGAFRKLLRPQDVLRPLPMKDRRARNQKTNIWKHAPQEWQYVLYMDADMLVAGKLDVFFAPLADGWDMVVTQGTPPKTPLVRQAQREKYKTENLYTNGVLGTPKWLQVAGGIWSFRRNKRTQRFLATFHKEWKRYQKTDQQSMMRAFWRCPVKMWTLPRQFNWFMHRSIPAKKDRAVVLHFATAARAWVEKHSGRKLWRKWREKV